MCRSTTRMCARPNTLKQKEDSSADQNKNDGENGDDRGTTDGHHR